MRATFVDEVLYKLSILVSQAKVFVNHKHLSL